MTFLLVGETGGSGEFAAAARGASRRSDRIGAGFAVIGGDSSDRLIGNGTSLGLEEVGIVFVLAGLPHPPRERESGERKIKYGRWREEEEDDEEEDDKWGEEERERVDS
ncbi:hypothetical protein DY000_02005198 [Brassica cretica]|uniref:Uncharacterized protein n=1 Tax=Brassica cretica TaxID=69181 RepID=A0ABQ7BW61_BRACR|nr:hypothetical protein DY000_02005198 [Brassica cretica]